MLFIGLAGILMCVVGALVRLGVLAVAVISLVLLPILDHFLPSNFQIFLLVFILLFWVLALALMLFAEAILVALFDYIIFTKYSKLPKDKAKKLALTMALFTNSTLLLLISTPFFPPVVL